MIERKITPGMGVNCYLVSCDQTGKAVIVDPGAGSAMLSKWIKDHNFEITHIILTHGHYDHIGAVEDLRKEFNVPVAIHKDDAQMLVNPAANLSVYSGREIRLQPAEILLEDNQQIEVGAMTITVFHTPGHTPGGICLLTPDGLLSGDTLFEGSIGRTDFPGGNIHQLLQSIQTKILSLDDSTNVYPGHEYDTTVGRERQYNPYVNGTGF